MTGELLSIGFRDLREKKKIHLDKHVDEVRLFDGIMAPNKNWRQISILEIIYQPFICFQKSGVIKS
jgi:hypothetical protein